MDNGLRYSFPAWIADIGEQTDFARHYSLDPVVPSRTFQRSPLEILAVGCGEGRSRR